MAYLRPPAFQRNIFNRIAMRFGIGGSETIVLPGQRSGKLRRVPVIPVEVGGDRYLVSTRGEAGWVRNLRAAGGKAVLVRKGREETITTTEVPAPERGPMIAKYREVGGKVVKGYFDRLPDDGDHPVFRIDR